MILFTASARLGRPPSFIFVRVRRRRRVPTANATNVKHKIKQLAPPLQPSQVFYILFGTYIYIYNVRTVRVQVRVIAGRRKRFRKRLFTRPDATGSARIYRPAGPGRERAASGAVHAREFAPGCMRATWPTANTPIIL